MKLRGWVGLTLGLVLGACGGASAPPERSSVLVTIVAPDTISNPTTPLEGRHLVITPVDINAEPAQRVYMHLGQRGTVPVAADPVWGAMADAGARVVVLAYHPSEPAADPAAIVEEQLGALLEHLESTAPADGGAEFVADGAPAWSNVIVSGNRDGADVAAEIAARHDVARAVYFSGPLNVATTTEPQSNRFAVGHRDDELEQRGTLWTEAGVPDDVIDLRSDDDLTTIDSGNRFISDLPLIDGFNERNDWQNGRYSSLWQYLCCS